MKECSLKRISHPDVNHHTGRSPSDCQSIFKPAESFKDPAATTTGKSTTSSLETMEIIFKVILNMAKTPFYIRSVSEGHHEAKLLTKSPASDAVLPPAFCARDHSQAETRIRKARVACAKPTAIKTGTRMDKFWFKRRNHHQTRTGRHQKVTRNAPFTENVVLAMNIYNSCAVLNATSAKPIPDINEGVGGVPTDPRVAGCPE